MKQGTSSPVLLLLATLLFWSIPLFFPQATIHWDLADVTYPAQKYFADSIHAGRLPYWTPFLYSGTPFLSDPQTGAWYPLHWPFFLIGITPRILFFELALHSFLALAGAFLLARKLLDNSVAAAVAAMFYAWGGFFAAHSSQLGKFEAAALLPWMLWASLAERRSWLLTGTCAGLILLTGDFDAAFYCFFALAFFLFAQSWKRGTLLAVSTPVIGLCLAAIAILPWLEIRKLATHAVLSPAASLRGIDLAAVMSADYFGLISGYYKGPDEIRQFYLYGGLLLLPLAIAGLIRRVRIVPILTLIVPALWYAFGPKAGLARLLSMPHAPIEIWFVPALGLAIAAGSGAAFVAEKMGQKRLPFILMVIIAADLWHFNMYKSPLVYASTSFETLYGKRQETFEDGLREIKAQPLYRLWTSAPSLAIGPSDGSLATRTEVTWGAGLADLNRYSEYMRAIPANPKLLHGLSANYLVDMKGRVELDPSALPRVFVPAAIMWVQDASAARAALTSMDPAQATIVEGPPKDSRQQQPAELRVVEYRENWYKIHYSAAAVDTIVRIAVPNSPGWTARVDGTATPIIPTDYAFSGVIAPAGQHDLTLEFRPQYLLIGGALSGITALGLIFLLLRRGRSEATPL
jgi:hypothetical protein